MNSEAPATAAQHPAADLEDPHPSESPLLDAQPAPLDTEITTITPGNTETPAVPGLWRRLFRRTERQIRFLAVADDRQDLAVLLECLYTARLLKKRHTGIHTAIVTHPDNQELLKLFQDGSDASQSTFDEVIAAPEQGKLRNTIMDYRTDILYLPDARLRTYMSTLFTGVKIKIGGSRLRLLSSLLRLHRVHQEKDLKRLKQKGFDLFPEMMSLKMDTTRIRSGRIPDVGRYVWLSLFDSHDLSGAWPPGHGARLTRMLKELDLQVLVPLPNGPQSGTTGAHAAEDHNRRRLERDVAYIKKHATNVHFLKDCSPEDRAAGMAAAQVIIAPAGPETVLASLMRRPVVILHDMRTYLNHPGHVPPPDSGKTKTRESRLRQPGALQIMSSPDFPLTSYIIKLANNLEKHIRPPVDHCKNDCPTCEYDSCVEFISPERVFESIKKIVLPF